MSQNTQKVVQKTDNFWNLLGLSDDEANILTTLITKGIRSPLELSRLTKLPRTRVYRTLEQLKNQGLIEEIVDEHRALARAVDWKIIEQKINHKQTEIDRLKTLLPLVTQQFTAQQPADCSDTQVLFYRGKQGLMQMVWHTLRAEKECIGYTYRRLEEYLGEDFMLDWRDNFMNKGLKFRDIYSDAYLMSYTRKKSSLTYPPRQWISRYISSHTLDINLQMDIYNDVVAQYNWHEGDVFGVEIYNRKIAAFHKQMFEIVWNLGQSGK